MLILGVDTWEATLSPAQNKQCLFCKPNSLRELPKLATRPHVPRVTSGLPLSDRDVQSSPALGTGRGWSRGQTLPSLSREHAAAARGHSWGKAPPQPIGAAASPRHKKAEGKAQAEAAPRSCCQERGRGPSAPRGRSGSQWKFPYSLHHEFVAAPGGGA